MAHGPNDVPGRNLTQAEIAEEEAAAMDFMGDIAMSDSDVADLTTGFHDQVDNVGDIFS